MNRGNIHTLQKIFLILSCIFLSASLVFEMLHIKKTDFSQGENNVVFMLDVSQSMNVTDMGGDSRLDAAKREIINIMRSNSTNNYALSIFAGESLRVLPFTTDIGLITTFLLGLDSESLTKQGSDIPGALFTSSESFNSEQTGKIILLTDGTDQDVKLKKELIEIYQNQSLELTILGVGTLEGGYIPSNSRLSEYKLYNGQIVNSSLNREVLMKVSNELSGEYHDITGFNSSDSIIVSSVKADFPYIFLLFITFWMLYLGCLYKSIFSKSNI